MINLIVFLKKCEEELLSIRQLSIDSLKLFDSLSLKDKKFCNPVIKLIRYPITDLMRNPIIESGNDSDNTIEQLLEFNEENYNSESCILICRLLPLYMGLDNDFFFSSTIVSKIVKSANEIRGLKLSDLIIAFFEIFCEFNVQMNKDIFAFYCLFMSDLSFNYRDRFVELDILENWGNPTHSNTTVTFFKFFLIDDNSPEFVIETMCILIDNECFDDFLHLMGYLFNDSYYKSEFKKTLTKSNITIELKNRIASLSVLD